MATVLCTNLLTHLDALLLPSNFKDYAPNGLQVEGSSEISKICTAVTASESVIDRCIELKADTLLVHHGYFWNGESPVITGMKRRRLAKLLAANINLIAYHIPLDCHLEFGNNVGLGMALGVEHIRQHRAGNIDDLLWSGSLQKGLSSRKLSQQLSDILKRTPLMIEGHSRPIQNIAWCTGAAQDYLQQAKQLGADAFISGEVSERTYYEAMELEMVFYSAGHHATERFGVQAVGNHLAQHFTLSHHFIDTYNPI